MHPFEENRLGLTRRRFFSAVAGSVGAGLGAMALEQLLGPGKSFAATRAQSGPLNAACMFLADAGKHALS